MTFADSITRLGAAAMLILLTVCSTSCIDESGYLSSIQIHQHNVKVEKGGMFGSLHEVVLISSSVGDGVSARQIRLHYPELSKGQLVKSIGVDASQLHPANSRDSYFDISSVADSSDQRYWCVLFMGSPGSGDIVQVKEVTPTLRKGLADPSGNYRQQWSSPFIAAMWRLFLLLVSSLAIAAIAVVTIHLRRGRKRSPNQKQQSSP